MPFSSRDRPYPVNNTVTFRLKQALAFGGFVFAFLWFFRPFQLDRMHESVSMIAAGFGAMTLIGMLLLNVALPAVFRPFFETESWTVGKEMLWVSLNIFVIGLLNFLFYGLFYPAACTFGTWVWFQMSTLAIGCFPVSFLVLWRESRARHRFSQEAQQLSAQSGPASPPTIVDIPSQNSGEDLSLPLSELLYLQVADNYLMVFYRQEGELKKTLLRNTLKNVEEQLSGHPELLRCHKSFLVNLKQVASVSGNAQGYRLHFDGTAESVPVSRKHNAFFRSAFS